VQVTAQRLAEGYATERERLERQWGGGEKAWHCSFA
jgi:hypothetical protein